MSTVDKENAHPNLDTHGKMKSLQDRLKLLRSRPAQVKSEYRKEEQEEATTSPSSDAVQEAINAITGAHDLLSLHEVLDVHEEALRGASAQVMRHSEPYLKAWLRILSLRSWSVLLLAFASLKQSLHSKENARDAHGTFKWLANNRVGLPKAEFWVEWAKCLIRSGSKEKALACLKKGLTIGATPTDLLESYIERISPGETHHQTVSFGASKPDSATKKRKSREATTSEPRTQEDKGDGEERKEDRRLDISNDSDDPTIMMGGRRTSSSSEASGDAPTDDEDEEVSFGKKADGSAKPPVSTKPPTTPVRAENAVEMDETVKIGGYRLPPVPPSRLPTLPEDGELQVVTPAGADRKKAYIEERKKAREQAMKETPAKRRRLISDSKTFGGGAARVKPVGEAEKIEDDNGYPSKAALKESFGDEKPERVQKEATSSSLPPVQQPPKTEAVTSAEGKELQAKADTRDGRDARAASSSSSSSTNDASSSRPRHAPSDSSDIIYVRRVPYTRLDVMGRGGSSKVFKVMGPDRKTYALKKIRTKGLDRETITSFENEIDLLKRLKSKEGIIRLINYEIMPGLIYVVLELGEIDLARKLFKMREESKPMNENFLRLRWQEMLEAVDTLHKERVVHSDLKPANFLFVEGSLKLIDFGIAKAISDDTTNIARESQVGTLNYMSPEAIQGQGGGPGGKLRLKMVYGKTPFAHIKNFVQKLQHITDPRGSLERDVKKRWSMEQLLSHPLLSGSSAPRAASSATVEPQIPLSQVQAMLRQMHANGGLKKDLNVDDLMSTIGAQVKRGREIDLTETLSSYSPSLVGGGAAEAPTISRQKEHQGAKMSDELASAISGARQRLRHVDPLSLGEKKREEPSSELEGLLRRGLSVHRRAIEEACGSRGIEDSTEDWRE